MKNNMQNKRISFIYCVVILFLTVTQTTFASEGDALTIETGFFKDPMYVLSNQEKGKLNDGMKFSAEFEKVLGLHPDALAAANKANGFRPVVIGGQLVLLGGTVVMLLETLKQSDDPLGYEPNYGLSLGLIIAGGVISIIGSSAFKSNLNKAVTIFNENEKKNPKLSLSGIFDVSQNAIQPPNFAMDITIDRSSRFNGAGSRSELTTADLNVLAHARYRF